MSSNKRIVIIGATSAIAEQCARLWVMDAPSELVLVGRSSDKLAQVQADLNVRAPQVAITVVTTDFRDAARIQSLADGICAQGRVDIVLIAHGSLPLQDTCQHDLQSCREALEINGVSVVLFAEAFARHLQAANHGTLALISSVAGDRGRKSNYVYGAAKGLVSRYAEGLQHRMAGTAVRVVLVKPGPTDTPMTAQLKQAGARLAPVDSVAKDIVRGISRGAAQVYTPRRWQLIMLVIRHLPRLVFDRLDI